MFTRKMTTQTKIYYFYFLIMKTKNSCFRRYLSGISVLTEHVYQNITNYTSTRILICSLTLKINISIQNFN